MNSLLYCFLVVFILNVSLKAQTINENYDQSLAESLNADDYGMKKYILVLLKSGSNRDTNRAVLDSVFNGHMKNINRLAEENKLIVAGPMLEKSQYRGIFILNTDNKEEAAALLETDPAVAGKFLEAEMYSWYGSAALQEITKIHRKIEKYSF